MWKGSSTPGTACYAGFGGTGDAIATELRRLVTIYKWDGRCRLNPRLQVMVGLACGLRVMLLPVHAACVLSLYFAEASAAS